MNPIVYSLAFAGIFIVTYAAIMLGYCAVVRILSGRWPL